MVTQDKAFDALEALFNGYDYPGDAGGAYSDLRAYIDQHASREQSGDWMQTFSGGKFFPLNPRPEDIHLDDIAKALSRLCRFAGHTEMFYSVAQHSVYVSAFVPPEHALCALMHDATEAYLVDVPRPLKKALPGYAEIEQNVWLAIAERFCLPYEMPECIKEADNRVLLAEKAQLLKPSEDWGFKETPAPLNIMRMTEDQAYLFFLTRFQHITRGVRL